MAEDALALITNPFSILKYKGYYKLSECIVVIQI